MRFLAVVLGAVLGGWMLLPAARADVPVGGDPAPVVADAGAGVAPCTLEGTDAEARDYAQREAESPEAREFVGGDGGFVVAILVLGLLVLLFLYLQKEGKI